MKVDILAIAAHPDDVELACSGTLLKHIEMGKKAGVLDLTRGELGTRGSAALRQAEATKAAEILGLAFRDNAGMEDGFFEVDKSHHLRLITFIRHYQPEIVLTNALQDRHPDHGRAARLVAEACFYSGLIKIETVRDGKQQEQWRPKAVYHFIQDRYIKPDFVIDVTAFATKKMEAIKAFRSQFYDPSSGEPETPISSAAFLEFVQSRMAEFGRPAGVRYAEGFNVDRCMGVKSLFDLY